MGKPMGDGDMDKKVKELRACEPSRSKRCPVCRFLESHGNNGSSGPTGTDDMARTDLTFLPPHASALEGAYQRYIHRS